MRLTQTVQLVSSAYLLIMFGVGVYQAVRLAEAERRGEEREPFTFNGLPLALLVISVLICAITTFAISV